MKKIFLSIIIALLIIFTWSTAVSALSFTATMTPSSTTVQESTEFTVTVKVSNLDVGTNGINSLSGYLKYDTDVFETISASSVEGLNSWSSSFEESTGYISLTKSTFVTSSQDVFQITFKTKSDISGESGTISFSDIVASNSESEISATDISTSITVGTSDSSGNTTNTNTSTNTSVNTIVANISTTNSNTSNTTNNTTNNTNVANTSSVNVVSGYVNTSTNTTSDSDLADTGVDDTILKATFLVIVVAFVFYIKIEKINKDMK